jgi:hypothetical protein
METKGWVDRFLEDEIKAKVSVPDLMTAQVTGQVMLDPDVNLIKVAGQAIGPTAPVPVQVSDGSAFMTPAKESGGNLEAIKAQVAKLTFDKDGNLMTSAEVTVIPTEDINIKTDSVGLAKESGGNLAGAKADLDAISGQLDAKTSTLAKETGGNLATIAGQLDSKTSTLAKESGGNLAAIKTDVDNLDVNLSTLAKESGGNLAAAKSDLDTLVTQTATPNIRALTTSDQVTIGDLIIALKRAIDVISHPLWWDVNLNSLKVALNVGGTLPTYASGATLPTVTTVATVTKLSQLTANGEPVFDIFLRHTWMNAWGNVVRRCITVS